MSWEIFCFIFRLLWHYEMSTKQLWKLSHSLRSSSDYTLQANELTNFETTLVICQNQTLNMAKWFIFYYVFMMDKLLSIEHCIVTASYIAMQNLSIMSVLVDWSDCEKIWSTRPPIDHYSLETHHHCEASLPLLLIGNTNLMYIFCIVIDDIVPPRPVCPCLWQGTHFLYIYHILHCCWCWLLLGLATLCLTKNY